MVVRSAFLALVLLQPALRAAPPPQTPPAPASFAYILQADAFAGDKAEAVQKLNACGRDWIVLDAAFEANTPWTREDLSTIRQGKPRRKILAYLSIGEAEDYRPYWRKDWMRDGKPSFLLAENPQWKGNYKVKYWHPTWQATILAAVNDIVARGFDGLYLDIVDGFEFFEKDGDEFIDDRINPETKQSYRRDMVAWVMAIAGRARAGNAAALILPQNGSQLLAHTDFLECIDGIGVEDLFIDGNKPQPKAETADRLDHLRPIQAAGKPVLVIEYPRSDRLGERVRQEAERHGFVWLVTDRQLKTLGKSGG